MALSGLDTVLPEAYGMRSASYERIGQENSTALTSQNTKNVDLSRQRGADSKNNFQVPRNLFDLSQTKIQVSHQSEIDKSSAQIEFLNVQKQYLEQIYSAQKGPEGQKLSAHFKNLINVLGNIQSLPQNSSDQSAFHELQASSKELALAINMTAKNYRNLKKSIKETLESDLDHVNELLMQVFNFNMDISSRSDAAEPKAQEVVQKRDEAIKALGDYIYFRVFPRENEMVSIQNQDGIELASDYVRPILLHTEDFDDQASLDYIDARQCNLGGKLGALISIYDEVLHSAIENLDSFAWRLSKRFEMQNFPVFQRDSSLLGNALSDANDFAQSLIYAPLENELSSYMYQKFARYVFSDHAYNIACNKNIYRAVDIRARQNGGMTLWKWLGLTPTPHGEDPYFDIYVGARQPQRVSITSQDDETDLVRKINHTIGVHAKIDRNGFLSIAAYEEKESGRVIYGSLELRGCEMRSANAKLSATTFGRKFIDDGITLLQALFGHYQRDEISLEIEEQPLILPVSYPSDLRFDGDLESIDKQYAQEIDTYKEKVDQNHHEEKIVNALWHECAQLQNHGSMPNILEGFMGFESTLIGSHQMTNHLTHLNAGLQSITI